LFWGCDYESEQRHIQGTRFYGVDYTLDQRYIKYVQFASAHGPKVGWYLLRRFAPSADESARGMSYPYSINLFFLGTNATLKDGFKLMGLGVERNSWGI